jgi:hypothetical protein
MWQVPRWALKAQEDSHQFAKVCAYCQWWIESAANDGDDMAVLPDPLDAPTLQATVARLLPDSAAVDFDNATARRRLLVSLDCEMRRKCEDRSHQMVVATTRIGLIEGFMAKSCEHADGTIEHCFAPVLSETVPTLVLKLARARGHEQQFLCCTRCYAFGAKSWGDRVDLLTAAVSHTETFPMLLEELHLSEAWWQGQLDAHQQWEAIHGPGSYFPAGAPAVPLIVHAAGAAADNGGGGWGPAGGGWGAAADTNAGLGPAGGGWGA